MLFSVLDDLEVRRNVVSLQDRPDSGNDLVRCPGAVVGVTPENAL